MAERACRDGFSKSPPFLRSLVEAGVPDDALERLEAKRKQLDDSIHRYIAAKEREFKNAVRDELQRLKLGLVQADADPSHTPASPTTVVAPPSPPRVPLQNVVDALLSAGLRRENVGQPQSRAVVDKNGKEATLVVRPSLAGLTDGRTGMERDKEFIGVFTPAFLPALELGRNGSSPTRAVSAPPVTTISAQSTAPKAVPRANSDSLVQPEQKRPVQLQLAGRTSSSGSSADGSSSSSRLTSALKSPTHPRPKSKRVSLAVGDSIVAPWDNVPVTLGSNNSTPSHSRTRSPGSDRDSSPTSVKSSSSPKDSPQQAESFTAPFSTFVHAPMTSNRSQRGGHGKGIQAVESGLQRGAAGRKPANSAADGDLEFALDEEDMIAESNRFAQASQSRVEEVVGRIKRIDDYGVFQPSEELIIEEEGEESDHQAEHIEFHPGSIQQTNCPGFRRPSVSVDPVFTGRDYDRAERNAVTNEIYGSSYARPNKGSFTAGLLGESFMATNAARMMKDRRSNEQARIRS